VYIYITHLKAYNGAYFLQYKINYIQQHNKNVPLYTMTCM